MKLAQVALQLNVLMHGELDLKIGHIRLTTANDCFSCKLNDTKISFLISFMSLCEREREI
jgi:hypothetical protein